MKIQVIGQLKQCATAVIMIGLAAAWLMSVTSCDTGGGGSSNPKSNVFSISGTISVAATMANDSDVNDPFAPNQAPNNTAQEAQAIGNPVTVGGYVNVPNAGEPGNSMTNGDPSDFFAVTLNGGETVTLYIADLLGDNDLDLYLYDADGNPLDESTGLGLIESLAVADAGTYLVEVHAYSGASNYVLSVGGASSANGAAYLDLNIDMVPGEAIVSFKDDPSASLAGPGTKQWAHSTGFIDPARSGKRYSLMVFNTAGKREALLADLGLPSAQSQKHFLGELDDQQTALIDTLQIITALNRQDDVRFAEPNYIRHALATPDDTHYSLQWHYPLIDLPSAWDVSTGSSQVVVAVIDTGVIMDHPDLAANLSNNGYDFISDPASALDGDGVDADPDDPGDQSQGGSSFHGTHVAGTIAAVSNNAQGVAGVSWSSTILPLRVLGKDGAGTSTDILEALKYAAGLETAVSAEQPTPRANIINLSLGGGGFSQAEQDLFTEIRNRGVIVIAAAGNEATNTPSYPAAYDGVVSVSAVDMNTGLAPYSNYGATIDVAAPGGDTGSDLNGDGYSDGVLSTAGDDSSGGSIANVYKFYQGTSMASPHMAGVAALMEAVRAAGGGDLTPDDLDGFLTSGAITNDLGDTLKFGHGLINAYKAVTAAQGVVPAALVATPAIISLGPALSEAQLTLQQTGGDAETVQVVSVSDDADWLEVAEATVDANGLGTYTVTADRDSGLLQNPGTYQATITAVSSANTASVPVTLQVSGQTTAGDAGFQYVLLLDAQDFTSVAQTEVSAANGRYQYQLSDVQTGDYVIFAGSDRDYDGYVGDAGESAGAYLSLDQPQVISVSANRSGINFTTGLDVNLPALRNHGPAKLKAGIRRQPLPMP
jgi:serine protease